jgi:hypothetical protein
LAKAPRLSDQEIEPYSVEEVQKLLASIAHRRNRARWAIALALGLRQGEVLGLKWTDVISMKGLSGFGERGCDRSTSTDAENHVAENPVTVRGGARPDLTPTTPNRKQVGE